MDTSPESRHNSTSKELLQCTREVKRIRGTPGITWLDNNKDWTRLSVDDLLDSLEKGGGSVN